MADKKFSELSAAGTLDGTELVAITQSGATVRTTTQAIANSTSSVTLDNLGLAILDTNNSHSLTIAPGTNLTADRTLTIITDDANQTLEVSGNVVLVAGTAATRAGAETLTNKTLTAPIVNDGAFSSPVLTTPHIEDSSADHQYIFAASELAADRTITLPLLTGNDEFVFKDHTQVLSNKTLSVLKTSVQTLSGAGAINITSGVTRLTTTGANALTLADGEEGQMKMIVMLGDGGDGTLTPANLGNGTTITFNDVGDSVLLIFLASDWWIISNNGCTVA